MRSKCSKINLCIMNSKKATMAVLDEDTILEIVVRLPLKYAIRCMVLNKNLFHLISQRKKALVSSAYPDIEGSILCRWNDITFKRIAPGSPKISITIPHPDNPIILDSCNGVLLLHFRKQHRICVFNPITGGIMPLSTLIKLKVSEDNVALAVDMDALTIFQFKLVVADTFSISEEETLWTFTVLVPSGATSWLIKSPVEFISRSDPCSCIGYAYVHGCVYWLDKLNNSIIMFDMEKEEATSIRSLEYAEEFSASLFGSLDGSLLSVYNLENEINICCYDQVEDAWQLKHKIAHTTSDPVISFCNGQHLLITDYSCISLPTFRDGLVFMYDILSDKWEKLSPEGFSFEHPNRKTFFPFVPTLAKVSDIYLHHSKTEFAEVYLQGLQRLVMQETVIG